MKQLTPMLPARSFRGAVYTVSRFFLRACELNARRPKAFRVHSAINASEREDSSTTRVASHTGRCARRKKSRGALTFELLLKHEHTPGCNP